MVLTLCKMFGLYVWSLWSCVLTGIPLVGRRVESQVVTLELVQVVKFKVIPMF
jgi:hypothetical protein